MVLVSEIKKKFTLGTSTCKPKPKKCLLFLLHELAGNSVETIQNVKKAWFDKAWTWRMWGRWQNYKGTEQKKLQLR